MLGSVTGGRLWDLYWRHEGGAGPFKSVKEFNDTLQEDVMPYVPLLKRQFHDPYRGLLSDSARIVFTHADINSHNIMIAGPPGSRRLVALIDWEQSGWYPEYWEYCKIMGCENDTRLWAAEGWNRRVMRSYEDELLAWAEYMIWRAP
jgi:aminoglycoside phosphotransferase (APT) family kinase protein